MVVRPAVWIYRWWCFQLHFGFTLFNPQTQPIENILFCSWKKIPNRRQWQQVTLRSLCLPGVGWGSVIYCAPWWGCGNHSGIQQLKYVSCFRLVHSEESCFFIFSITRYHNIECATWATRLVCPVEVTGLANGLQNVYSGSVGKKIMGFIWMRFNILIDSENLFESLSW